MNLSNIVLLLQLSLSLLANPKLTPTQLAFVNNAVTVAEEALNTSLPTSTPIAAASPTIAPLSISYINPSIVVGGRINILTVQGAGFQNDASVMIGGIALSTTTTNFSPNSISVNFPTSFPAGIYGVTVTNPNGETATLANAFTVTQPQQISSQPTNYIDFDTNAVATSSQNLENLQDAYAQAEGETANTPGLSIQDAQGRENILNALYSPQLQAAQLTLQDAEAQERIDQNYSISAGVESDIEYEQSQNEQCASSYNLNEAGGEQGIQAQEQASECVASAEKEANDIQNEE